MGDSIGWRVRRGSEIRTFSDRLVIQGRRPGVLDLSVCLLVSGQGNQASTGKLGFLGPLAAACTSEGIRRDTGIISWLHWPDLVTIEGRVVAKTSLSLAERGPDGSAKVVLRICVNCFAETPAMFPSSPLPTSLFDALGVEIDLDLLRDKILHAVDWYFAEWERGMHRKLVDRIAPTISWLGGYVEVRTTDAKVLTGRAKGLDERGSLLLERRGGTLTVPAGSVELVTAVK
ncbi:MAG TPA: hypothetical protein VGS04_06400 [Nitrososphaerales archaeon]|nr:hypothetical protein [Nitrososphaerales archaeon]